MKKIFIGMVLCSFIATSAMSAVGIPRGTKGGNSQSTPPKNIEISQVQ